jgi:hypothetical protein
MNKSAPFLVALIDEGNPPCHPKGVPMRTAVRHVALVILFVVGSAAQAACMRCAPILNVSDAAVVGPAGKRVSAGDVRAAIIRAGAGLGWQIKDDGPGKLQGTLVLRTHTAVVAIPYSATSYSIQYLSSINLDAGEGQIHRNYNGWISNLAKGINAQVLLT